jgi:hypothetical protein
LRDLGGGWRGEGSEEREMAFESFEKLEWGGEGVRGV